MNFQEEHGAEGGWGVRVHVDPQHGLLLQLRLLLHGQALWSCCWTKWEGDDHIFFGGWRPCSPQVKNNMSYVMWINTTHLPVVLLGSGWIGMGWMVSTGHGPDEVLSTLCCLWNICRSYGENVVYTDWKKDNYFRAIKVASLMFIFIFNSLLGGIRQR